MTFNPSLPFAEWHLYAALGAVFAAGLARLIYKFICMIASKDLAQKARDNFLSYCENPNDSKGYEHMDWLMTNSHRLETQLGSGDYGAYQPSSDIQMIFQSLPKLRKYIIANNEFGLRLYSQNISVYVREIDFAFARCIGALEYEIPLQRRKIYNPLSWLREGVAFVLSLPLLLLSLLLSPFSVFGAATVKRILKGQWFQSLSILVGVIAGGITIVVFIQSFL